MDTPRQAFDTAGFRTALSSFATGVAIVSTTAPDGKPVGVTINSFTSVSLAPPLVLWNIAKSALSHDVFVRARYFCINVLAMHQQELSMTFSRTGADKFSDLTCSPGLGGVPKLPEFAACFECETECSHKGGDHTIIIGKVCAFEDRETDPLIFYRGRFLRKGGPYPQDRRHQQDRADSSGSPDAPPG